VTPSRKVHGARVFAVLEQVRKIGRLDAVFIFFNNRFFWLGIFENHIITIDFDNRVTVYSLWDMTNLLFTQNKPIHTYK